MLIKLNDIILIYEKILEDINIDYVSVVIYSAVDIDSLCSLKILSKFFKSESIQYKVYPVTNYTQLQQRIQDSRQYEKVRLFMFINCGGCIDLSQKWFMYRQQNPAKIILFDSNKPTNHKNIESKSILVIDDEYSSLHNIITSQEVGRLDQFNQLDIDEQIDFQQQENQQLSGNQPRPPKRGRNTYYTQKMKKHKQLLQKKFDNYYGNRFYSLPSSHCIYKLIRQHRKSCNYTLWYAIVGMTSMYLQNSISRDVLQTLTNFYRSDMVKLNSNNNQKKQKGQIFTRKSYQFTLMNHWSLYDSMLNSPYLMIKLNLWNDKGVTKLHQILTKIGISLEQSKQQYKYMLKQLKDSLEEKMFTIAEDQNLVEITYQSFMKQTDSSSSYMASDIYYIISTILERPPTHRCSAEELRDHRLECFWEAYSLLDGSQDMIRQVGDQCKEKARIMMKQVKDIVERDSIISINKVYFSNIRCDTRQKRILQHPSALIRLAYILMGIQKQRKKTSSRSNGSAPCLVSLLDVETNRCLVVGVVTDYKSSLGTKFHKTVLKLDSQVEHDKFMSTVIVIPKEILIQFIKEVGISKEQ